MDRYKGQKDQKRLKRDGGGGEGVKSGGLANACHAFEVIEMGRVSRLMSRLLEVKTH